MKGTSVVYPRFLGIDDNGDECWRQYAPSDIRRMVNDAAREVGLDEFADPEKPEEDKPL